MPDGGSDNALEDYQPLAIEDGDVNDGYEATEPAAEPEESPAAEPEESPAAEPEESPAAEPEESPAAEPEAAEPEESRVAEPEESRAAEPEESRAADTEESQAAEPEESQAAEPEESRPAEPEESRPAEPEDSRPAEPGDFPDTLVVESPSHQDLVEPLELETPVPARKQQEFDPPKNALAHLQAMKIQLQAQKELIRHIYVGPT